MTTEKTSNIEKASTNHFKKLSIQVGLNGLSFCVADTIANKVLDSGKVTFKTASTPYLIQKALKSLLEEKNIEQNDFSEVVVVHRNNLFSLVPNDLFNKEELPNYLKFNTKLLANDHIVFDEVETFDIVNVYVPFTNVNNYIFGLFGEFEFKHSGTVLLQALSAQKNLPSEPVCYVYVAEKDIEVVVLSQKRMIFYNHFDYRTKEDFIYYVLFVYEQLGLNPEVTPLKLFGCVEEDDDLYKITYEYIAEIAVFSPSGSMATFQEIDGANIDFSILSAF